MSSLRFTSRVSEEQYLNLLQAFNRIKQDLGYSNLILPSNFLDVDFSQSSFSLLRGFQQSVYVAKGLKHLEDILGPNGEEFSGMGLVVDSVSSNNLQISKKQLWASLIKGRSFSNSSISDEALKYSILQDSALSGSYINGKFENVTIRNSALYGMKILNFNFLDSLVFENLWYNPKEGWFYDHRKKPNNAQIPSVTKERPNFKLPPQRGEVIDLFK